VDPAWRSSRTFYRSRFANGFAWLICAWACAVLLELATEAPSTGLAAFDYVLAAIFLVPALREPLNGVVTTADKVLVRNVLRTRVLSWHEIEKFELARYDPWPKIGVAVLTSGARVGMVGVQWAPLSRYAEETVTALNSELVARQLTDEGPSADSGLQAVAPRG
jgi:PH (Pleckstrin Homology) domain-containing protein